LIANPPDFQESRKTVPGVLNGCKNQAARLKRMERHDPNPNMISVPIVRFIGFRSCGLVL
jgi:hypothetical protein